MTDKPIPFINRQVDVARLWAVRWDDNGLEECDNETYARWLCSEYPRAVAVLHRELGPWTEVPS